MKKGYLWVREQEFLVNEPPFFWMRGCERAKSLRYFMSCFFSEFLPRDFTSKSIRSFKYNSSSKEWVCWVSEAFDELGNDRLLDAESVNKS